jgi:hypothetical protein
MFRELRPGRVVSSLLALAAAVGLSVVSIAPVQAATNPTLGDLSAANPAANQYAGCVASVLTGSGVTFGSAAALGTDLAALWPTLPAAVADACKQAVDTRQPQVCVNPTTPAPCPAIGAATAASLADQAVGFTGEWKLVTDGAAGVGGYAQTPLATGGSSAPMATVSGTFTTPTSVCTSSVSCAAPAPPGLWTDCGPYTCGPVTTMTVSVVGRTPNGENGVLGHIHVADAFGHVSDVASIFSSNGYWGNGCGAGDCIFLDRVTWNCKDVLGASANCGGQTLAVSFTFDSGTGGGCHCASPAPALGQLAEIQLTANNLNFSGNPTACPGMLDCLRYDDSRLSYLDASSRPTAVLNSVPPPSAVIDLAASGLGCLVGVDTRSSSGISCPDVNGAFAALVQAAHAVVGPPTITGSASPSGGWPRTPVTVSLSASADTTRSIHSITYSATGAQPTPETVVTASAAQVVVSADGVTSLNYWATDNAGISSSVQNLAVQVDGTAPAIVCAAPSASWSGTDVTIACTASDAVSGLADPTQAQLSLTTAVPAGTETATASTGSTPVCDAAGNCAAAGPATGVKVDRLGPSIMITAPSGTYTTGQVVTTVFACTDGGSGTATCAGSRPDGSAVDTTTPGTYSFTVDATDFAGNHAQRVASYTVTAPPTITGTATPSGGWQPTPVSVSFTASADPQLAVQSITYSASGAQATPDVVIPGSTAELKVSAEGATTLYFWATDSLGATSAAQSIAVQVDRTAPVVTCATPGNAWRAADVTVACTASDGLSGLAHPTQAQLVLTTSVPNGTETAAATTGSATVCDVAGNCTPAGPIAGLKVDRLGPSITITAPTGNYTVGQVVNDAYSCTDGGSGVASCTGSEPTGTANTATSGLRSFTVDATDAAGNHTQRVSTYVVSAPPPPPTVTASTNPAGGWQRTPVTVSLTASDGNGPGVTSITYRATGGTLAPETVVPGSSAQVVVSADGATTLTFWATDAAGASGSQQSITVQVDRTAPAITCATPGTGWSTLDLTIACTASDSLSGLATPAQAQFTLTTSVPASSETAAAATNSITVCDVAGNCAAAGPITGMKVDRLGPAITITAPTGTYSVGQVVKAAYSCTDAGSGVATCSGTVAGGNAVDTATAGTHSFTVDATDAAGNHTQRVVSYAVTATAPNPTCKPDEKGDGAADNKCDKHDVEVRPVAGPTPAPTPKPKPTPTPKPKTKPTPPPGLHRGDETGNQGNG